MTWPPSSARAGVLVDFDGTLSAIVDDPMAARPLPGALSVLGALVSRFAVVAVVSGRPVSFLTEHIPVDGVEHVGLYGMEWTASGSVTRDPLALTFARAVTDAVREAQASAPPSVFAEDKGLALGLHWRPDPSGEEWARAFAASAASRWGLQVHDAKMSVELRPPVEIDKGIAVSRLLARHRLDAACFVGDDLGDLRAFSALSAVASPLRVAVRSSEAPRALLDAADLVVDGPDGALAWLQTLV